MVPENISSYGLYTASDMWPVLLFIMQTNWLMKVKWPHYSVPDVRELTVI